MRTLDILQEALDVSSTAVTAIQASSWADAALAALRHNKDCLVITHDPATKFVAEHLAEEFNVRYRAGSPFNRPDRIQIPCISCLKEEQPLFPSSRTLGFSFDGTALQLSIHSQLLSIPIARQPDFFAGLVGRLIMHGICEWFEPEFGANFQGSPATACIRAFSDFENCIAVLVKDPLLLTYLQDTAFAIKKIRQEKGFIFMFGNGGSATDCVELADFGKSCGLPATHLLEAGYVTCAYNDSHPVFARAFEQLRPPHAAFAFSTSGVSENVNLALKNAAKNGLTTIALCGKSGGTLMKEKLASLAYQVKDDQTQRIQEVHYLLTKILFLTSVA